MMKSHYCFFQQGTGSRTSVAQAHLSFFVMTFSMRARITTTEQKRSYICAEMLPHEVLLSEAEVCIRIHDILKTTLSDTQDSAS